MLKVDNPSLRGSIASFKSKFRDLDSRSFVLRDCDSAAGFRLRDNDSYRYYSSGQLNNEYPAKLLQPDEEKNVDDLDPEAASFQGSSLTLTVSLDGSTNYIDSIKPLGTQKKFNPPDGGYGWLVVFASFLLQGITGSIGYIHGMLYPEFLEAFDAGGVTTAWVSSIQIAVWFTGAMIAGPLVQTIGTKKVCMIGATIITLSLVATSLAQHISMLYIFYGFTTGIGMSFIFFPAVIVVQQYFVKKRAIAVAIANAGVSFGGFAMPPLCDFLLQTYGWRGNMLIMAGIAANVFIICCAFKPVNKRKQAAANTEKPESEKSLLDIRNDNEPIKPSETKPIGISPQIKRKDDQTFVKLLGKKMIEEKLRNDESLPKMVLTTSEKDLQLNSKEGGPLARILGKKIIEEKLRNEESLNKVPVNNCEKDTKSKDGMPLIKVEDQEGQTVDQPKHSKFKAFLKRLTDFSLLKNPNMTFDMFAYGFFSFGFIVPSMFLPLKAYQLGIPHPKPTLLISIIGISDVIGRFVTGFMGQLLGRNRLVHYMLSMFIGGAMTAMSSLIHNFIGLACYACIFGLCTGMARAYSSIVLTDMLGLENLPKAYGFKLFLNGFTVLGSAPFAAFVMESTGSIDMSFLIIGIVQGMGGVTIFILLILRHCGCAPVRKSWI